MPLYGNEICPVCKKAFTAEDDIVCCPVCGTPHHRACYNLTGECANKALHKDGFDYFSSEKADKSPKSEESSESNQAPNNEYYVPETHTESAKTRCVKCGEEIEKDAPFCNKCGERQPDPSYSEYTPPSFAQYADSYAQSEDKQENGELEGKSLKDISCTVRTNQHKFIPKFIANRKLSWNWASFIFGPFYLLFRKMYKEGIIFLAVRFALSLFIQGAYAEEFAAFYGFVNEHMTALTENVSEALINQLMPLYQKLLPMFLLMLAVNLIINIIIALTSDYMYKKRVFQIIEKVDKELENGAQFGQIMPMMPDMPQLSQNDMRRLYLNKLGGTSFAAPLLAYFILEIASSLISRL